LLRRDSASAVKNSALAGSTVTPADAGRGCRKRVQPFEPAWVRGAVFFGAGAGPIPMLNTRKEKSMSNVYRMKEPGDVEGPDYVIRDGRFYRTVLHPAGWSDVADYELRSDGKIYPLDEGESVPTQAPVYEFKEIMLYRTDAHPGGPRTQPDYYIFD
jgi:hypothetical protein